MSVYYLFDGKPLPNGNLEMRVHYNFEPIHRDPAVIIAVSGIKMTVSGRDIDYRIYAKTTCPGIGTPAFVCDGFDVVAETGPGTNITSFEGTVLYMDVGPTP